MWIWKIKFRLSALFIWITIITWLYSIPAKNLWGICMLHSAINWKLFTLSLEQDNQLKINSQNTTYTSGWINGTRYHSQKILLPIRCHFIHNTLYRGSSWHKSTGCVFIWTSRTHFSARNNSKETVRKVDIQCSLNQCSSWNQ